MKLWLSALFVGLAISANWLASKYLVGVPFTSYEVPAKTAVRFARPWLPLTADPGFAVASSADGAVVQSLDVIDGEAVPMIEGGEDV